MAALPMFDPPCDECTAECCKVPAGAGRDHIVPLDAEEQDNYPHVWVDDPIHSGAKTPVLPVTKSGRCVYLGRDNRCTIYSSRPNICREYNCALGHPKVTNRPGHVLSTFLEDRPKLLAIIERRLKEAACSDKP